MVGENGEYPVCCVMLSVLLIADNYAGCLGGRLKAVRVCALIEEGCPIQKQDKDRHAKVDHKSRTISPLFLYEIPKIGYGLFQTLLQIDFGCPVKVLFGHCDVRFSPEGVILRQGLVYDL